MKQENDIGPNDHSTFHLLVNKKQNRGIIKKNLAIILSFFLNFLPRHKSSNKHNQQPEINSKAKLDLRIETPSHSLKEHLRIIINWTD